jgi:YkoY family integral membrane protein
MGNPVLLVIVTIVWLVFLEGLLSADNALVLAMMVRHLSRNEQKRALRYGIWGAFTFRIIAVLLAKYLLSLWYLKLVGGLYLVYLAVSHLVSKSKSQDELQARRVGSGFWGTVVSVEIADIAFSIDSILAAVALADGLPPDIGETTKFWVVVSGGILGIITMRFVAGYFIILLERFKGLESGAYALVAWIGLKLITGGLHNAHYIPYEMNEWIFWPGMILIVVACLLYNPKPAAPLSAEDSQVIEDVTRIASGDALGDDLDAAAAADEASLDHPHDTNGAPRLDQAEPQPPQSSDTV